MLLLKLSLRPWRLAPYSQIFSSLAVGFLLLLAGFLYWMQQGLRPVLSRLQHEQVITAYLAPDVEAKDEARVVDSIRTALGAHAVSQSAADVQFVDRSKFVEKLKSSYPDLGGELEDLGAELTTIVPRYVSISGFFNDNAIGAVRGVQGIESAETSKDRYQHVLGAFSTLRWVARLLALGLCLALLTGLIHLSRMNSFLHREIVALLRLWGGHEVTLRFPGILSGLAVGLAGGLMAGVGWLTGGAWLARHIRSLSPLLREMPSLPVQFAFLLFAAGCSIGLMAGLFGTLLSATGSQKASLRNR